MDTREQIIAAAYVWQKQTGKSLATLSHALVGNGNWIDKLIAGADLTGKRYKNASTWFAERGIKLDELKGGDA